MQPLTLTSNFNGGYYSSSNSLKLNQIPLECDSDSSADNNKSSESSPKPNCKSSSDRSDSPVICESSGNQTTSQSGKTAGYLNNLSKSLAQSLLNKMSKANSLQHSLNNENIHKHNSIRSLDSIEKQQAQVHFRRLITSIFQHANNIAPDTGDRVHALIIGLVSSTCSIDEFQVKIQELINYPLRSHVISFIRSFLPAFQVELAQFARISKQNLTQFVKQHESLFLEINSSNALVDLDELLSTTSSHQLKRRYSPDFLIDSENLNLTPSGKRFHSMQHRSTASPTAKLATGAQSINQAIAAAQQANNLSTSKASMAGNSSVTSSAMNCAGLNSSSLANAGLTNPSILHSHLAQARQAMLEELMGNRYYQSPIQQQFNLINQQLNQQIVHGSNNPKLTKQQQQNSLMQHANGNHLNSGNLNSNLSSNLSSNLNSNQLNSGSGVGSQLTSGNQLNNQLAGQLSGHLQANLLVNNPLNLNKQQLERLALLERYEKELALQQQAKQQNDLRLEANAQANAQKLRTNGLPMNVLAPQQQQGQLMNGLNLSASSGSASQHPPTAGHHQRPVEQPMNEEEFKNIETMLNCIINMVEKTKKALSILQQKNHQQQENRHEQANSPNADWARAKMPLKTLPINKNLNNVASQPARSLPLKSSTPPIISLDGDYIDLRKSKDQLFSSLNIVSNPVTKMPLNRSNAQTDLMAIEKSKMESILNNMRRQVVQELQTNNVQEDSLEACWNCGRKATDTCSGCNEAKYCGAFCQQKDWESHHENCGKNAAAANLAPENLSTVNESSESSSVNCQADDAEPTEENRLGLICKETVKGKENVKSNSTKESVPAADPANNLANDDTGKDEEKDESLATGDDDSAELKIVTETEEISSSSKRDTKEKASD